ncbi:hypothetical protein [Mycetocola sp. JXN-3]|uniref:hypothetical protein n=1 Tax=Mycetocola sp. JXN-3 TaxID=2116510 RepID=UPI00165D1552|nr:hypothetical protein [Mycetocola sp. JXN-3]
MQQQAASNRRPTMEYPHGPLGLGVRVPGTGNPARLFLACLCVLLTGASALLWFFSEDAGNPAAFLGTHGIGVVWVAMLLLVLRALIGGVWVRDDAVLVRSWWLTRRFARIDITRVSVIGGPSVRLAALEFGLGTAQNTRPMAGTVLFGGRIPEALLFLAEACDLPPLIASFPDPVRERAVAQNVRGVLDGPRAEESRLVRPRPAGPARWHRVRGTGTLSGLQTLPLAGLLFLLGWGTLSDIGTREGSAGATLFVAWLWFAPAIFLVVRFFTTGLFVRSDTVLMIRLGFPTLIRFGEATRVDIAPSDLPWGQTLSITRSGRTITLLRHAHFPAHSARIRDEVSAALGLPLSTDPGAGTRADFTATPVTEPSSGTERSLGTEQPSGPNVAPGTHASPGTHPDGVSA